MLSQLRIRNLGVIEDATLDLHAGLNVVTGETGAGKTMVVEGLGLLLGSRADSGLVRAGAPAAIIEGILELAADHPGWARATEAGAEVEDELVLARSISDAGRSRAVVGGRSAPVGVLAELGESLVAVHGQADQWRLRRPDQHREVLDGFGGADLARGRQRYADLFDRRRQARARLDELTSQANERARRIEAITIALEQLEALDPVPAEDEALRAEEDRLAHAETLRAAAGRARGLLAGADDLEDADPDSMGNGGGPAVTEALGRVRDELATVIAYDLQLSELHQRATEAGYLVVELAADLAGYAMDIAIDPARLAYVQQRRAALTALARRLGVEPTADGLREWGAIASAELVGLLSAADRIGTLGQECDRIEVELAAAAVALHEHRVTAAAEFGDAVCAELAHLAMGSARVEVSVQAIRGDERDLLAGDLGRVRAAGHGIDEVEIRLAANAGSPARSVTRAASGGELSRVMLAIELVTAAGSAGAAAAGDHAAGDHTERTDDRVQVGTFVFDEVDAGVGGVAALDVGARLAALAQHHQVLVVTHLAQVAAFADHHLVVAKRDDGSVTASSVSPVTGADRLAEITRLMAGDPGSDTGLAHARELLAAADARRTDARRTDAGVSVRAGRSRARS